MADKTDLCARGRAYTQLMWVGMQSCFKGRCKILAVAQSPDEFRSVHLLLRKGILPVFCVCPSVLRSLICYNNLCSVAYRFTSFSLFTYKWEYTEAVFTHARNIWQHALSRCCSSVCANVCRVCPKREGYTDESEQQFSASAPPASLSLLGNFEVQQTNTIMPSVQPRPQSETQMPTWLLAALIFVWSLERKSLLFCLKQ